MVFGRFFDKDNYFENQATNLVQSASIFATNSTVTAIDNIPLISDYFKSGAVPAESWDFHVTVASVGTAFVTIADYVPEDKRETVYTKIGEELFRFHSKGYQALENLSGLLHRYCEAGIPFHQAMGSWLSINLLEKNDPEKEEIEAFSAVGAMIQHTFGGWFRKQKTV